MTTTSAFPFPHVELTKIEGKPSAATIKQLKKELYANTRAVHCDLGGGVNGYLGTVMPAAAYFLRAGTAFIVPIHPGTQAAPIPNATGNQIVENNRIYDKAKANYTTYSLVTESLRQQVLNAVNPLYYQALEDEYFGHSDVTVPQIMQHLQTTYGTVNATDLVNNRSSMSDAWNPDEPFENLWKRIRTIRQVAIAGTKPISDEATIELTLTALRKAGVYEHAIITWEDKDAATQTWAAFQLHFTKQEKLRLKKLTATAAGYHGVNKAAVIPPDDQPPPEHRAAAAAANTKDTQHCDGQALYYCWSHGVGINPDHTSKTCSNTTPGHDHAATLMHRKGGSTLIACGRTRYQGKKPSAKPPT
jgi:hypothetical protein